MDNTILKKRLSTYRSDKDQLKNLPADVLLEVLNAWEKWPGKLKDFYMSIGVSPKQMAGIMGKAKKLRRDGHFPAEEFKEMSLESVVGVQAGSNPCQGIELSWEQGKVIRFPEVSQLIDFLKKVA